jgi:hypothetical protein
MTRRAVGHGDPVAGDGDPGGFTGLAVEAIIGHLDQMASENDQRRRKPRVPFAACHPIWQTGTIPLVAGAGTLIQSALYGPELPYWWDLRTVSLWGFTAGTVTVYLNNVNGEQIGQTTVPGQFTWGNQELIGPQDSLVFGATGVTGVVNLTVRAIEIQTAWLPEYLM